MSSTTNARSSTLKKRLRAKHRETRGLLQDELRRQLSQSIKSRVLAAPEILSARSVFTYISWQSEVATHALIDSLESQGKSIFVPRTEYDGIMSAVPFPGWDELVAGNWGIPTPRTPARSTRQADVILVPGLAFTEAGTRLGYGAGYYDRWLSAHSYGVAIGLSFESQVTTDLPTWGGDVAVDLLVTERRIVDCRSIRERPPRTDFQNI